MLEQLHLLTVRDLADVLPLAVEVRPHGRVEVLLLGGLGALARDLQRQARLQRDRDRPVRALVRAHPAEEEQVVAPLAAVRVDGEVEEAFGTLATHGSCGRGTRWLSESEISRARGAICATRS